MPELRVVRSELILGGQGSGKTARADALAAAWLDASAAHQAVYIGTAQAWDSEMRERISRAVRRQRPQASRMKIMEEPSALAQAIGQHSRADTLIIVDCLTLWLTASLMPEVPGAAPMQVPSTDATAAMAAAVAACAGPLVLISNEGAVDAANASPSGEAFADALGRLNQAAAGACERVTLMSAGMPILLKGQP